MALLALPGTSRAVARTAASFPTRCAYTSRGGELTPVERCARRENDGFRIAPDHLARMVFTRGLADVGVDGVGWAYVRRDGVGRGVETFDNGPDPFVEGLTRARSGGKIVFLDRRLRPRLVTRYDWASPFEHGRARACTGCVGQTDGEHGWMTGGRWVEIDRHGREFPAPR